jgi:hypothetical protein
LWRTLARVAPARSDAYAARQTRGRVGSRHREDLGDLVRTRLRWCATLALLGVVITVVQSLGGIRLAHRSPCGGLFGSSGSPACGAVANSARDHLRGRDPRHHDRAVRPIRLDGDAVAASFVTTMGSTPSSRGAEPQGIGLTSRGYAAILALGAAPITATARLPSFRRLSVAGRC